jgi:hypothetical protein
MLTLVAQRPSPSLLSCLTIAVQDQGVKPSSTRWCAWIVAMGEGGGRDAAWTGAEARFRALLAERLLSAALARALPGSALEDAVTEIAERRTDSIHRRGDVLARTIANTGGEAS